MRFAAATGTSTTGDTMPESDTTIFENYLKSVHEVHSRGDAREESFYGSLKDLLLSFAEANERADAHVTSQPTATDGGNPDFRVWDGKDRITGYIEAKHPSKDNLESIEQSEQLQRYLDTFPNLILTNFLEFRLYREGQMVDRVIAARPRILTGVGAKPPVEDAEGLTDLLEKFFSFSLPRPMTAESLAVELARRTRFLRDQVARRLRLEERAGAGRLTGFYESFQKYLIGHLEKDQFADLYAQTVTYGLFAARTRADGEFSRRLAYDLIPHTIGILRELFQFVSLGDLPEELEWIVDDIAHCLAVTDAGGILDKYYKDGKGSDPIVHFYETFLAEYDPEERERRGVYYTPEPVVDYIVRSLHNILKDEFDMYDGLASKEVTLLDPAAGTMTFVARASQEAAREFEKYGSGAREAFVREHILEKFHAFELMMAPYAVGHLKMSFFLEELGHRLEEDERFNFYLTNALEMEELDQTTLPGMSSLADESRRAGEVKKKKPILVILGNPPYSGHSANKGEWILDRIDDYKQVDGKPLGEKNPKWLQDDYVKFLRFAQWKMDQAPGGVVGMITNHSYLDNPTFRGMRQSLMNTFDRIYVLDLHGSSLKQESSPDGSKDENVFDIRQGVAIAFFIKTGKESKGPAIVNHSELWGSRANKYDWLKEHGVMDTEWHEVTPCSEFYLYVPRDEAALERYNDFASVTELFPLNSVAIVTARDKFVVDFDRHELEGRIRQFRDPTFTDDFFRKTFGLRDNQDWAMEKKRIKIQEDDEWKDKILSYRYRPFDDRWIFYHYHAVDRGREEVMQHFQAGENIALVTCRQLSTLPWQHVFVSDFLTDDCFVSNRSRERAYVFPLFVSAERTTTTTPGPACRDLFADYGTEDKLEPNLDAYIAERLAGHYGDKISPRTILDYVYAVLHSAHYREKYSGFLKMDFPRIPFPADRDVFCQLSCLGEALVALHLLNSSDLHPAGLRFPVEGDNRVVRRKSQGFGYDQDSERMYINKKQYFEPIPLDLYEYQIGGYQVLHKWLKDRKDRRLSWGEIRTYCRIVTAIRKTIEIQEEIDALYPAVEEDVITF